MRPETISIILNLSDAGRTRRMARRVEIPGVFADPSAHEGVPMRKTLVGFTIVLVAIAGCGESGPSSFDRAQSLATFVVETGLSDDSIDEFRDRVLEGDKWGQCDDPKKRGKDVAIAWSISELSNAGLNDWTLLIGLSSIYFDCGDEFMLDALRVFATDETIEEAGIFVELFEPYAPE
jgi:hypothetical protein